ncbi:unnamed protein product, partial [Ectocarpus fasciculatus]
LSRRITQHPAQLIHARSFPEGTAAAIPIVITPANGGQSTRLHVARLSTLSAPSSKCLFLKRRGTKHSPSAAVARLNQPFDFFLQPTLTAATSPLPSATQELQATLRSPLQQVSPFLLLLLWLEILAQQQAEPEGACALSKLFCPDL